MSEAEQRTLSSVLKAWAGATTAQIIFDSTVDEFDTPTFFSAIRGKRNVASFCITSRGDVCGGFTQCPIWWRNDEYRDPGHFVFSFQSRGRFPTPQRWFLRPEVRHCPCVTVPPGSDFLLTFGDRYNFGLGNERANTTCEWMHATYAVDKRFRLTTTDPAVASRHPHTCVRVVAVWFPACGGD